MNPGPAFSSLDDPECYMDFVEEDGWENDIFQMQNDCNESAWDEPPLVAPDAQFMHPADFNLSAEQLQAWQRAEKMLGHPIGPQKPICASRTTVPPFDPAD